ncbi:MAG: hypothetical protein NVSMB48_04810 [Marmoricola sp.]
MSTSPGARDNAVCKSERAAARGRESGAVAIVLALITCFVIVPLAGLAVDIGTQRVARSDMQTIADLAATDMARVLGGGVTPTAAMATASANRDVGSVGGAPTMQVYVGYISATPTYVSSQSRGCNGSPYDAYFQSPSAGQAANAVVVTATTSVSFMFHGGAGGTCRSALAQVNGTACYSLGSYAAVVNSGNSAVLSPLNSIFGLNFSLLSYQNIAGAKLTLAQLAADSHIGTASQLMNGSITVTNLVLAMIDVLQQGSGNTAAVTALNSVLTVVTTLPAITLSHVLNVSPTDTAAMSTQFSALDILAGAVLLADGQHAVDIPNVWAGVAGTGETSDASLYVQQGASVACGKPGSAPTTNSQLSGYVAFDKMNSPSINIGLANLKTGIGTGRLTVAIAQAQGQLDSSPPVVCGSNTVANPTTFSVDVSAALSSEQLLTQLPVSGTVTILGLGAVSLNLTVDVSVQTTRPAGTSTANVSIPPNDTTPISTGSGIALDYTTATTTIDSTASTATVLGLPISLSNPLLVPTLNSIISAVQSTFVAKTVDPLVTNVNSLVSGPIATLLGIDVGGADVYGIKTSCINKPNLAG